MTNQPLQIANCRFCGAIPLKTLFWGGQWKCLTLGCEAKGPGADPDGAKWNEMMATNRQHPSPEQLTAEIAHAIMARWSEITYDPRPSTLAALKDAIRPVVAANLQPQPEPKSTSLMAVLTRTAADQDLALKQLDARISALEAKLTTPPNSTTCPTCKGTRKIWNGASFIGSVPLTDCYTCNGTGYLPNQPPEEAGIAELKRQLQALAHDVAADLTATNKRIDTIEARIKALAAQLSDTNKTVEALDSIHDTANDKT